MANIKSAIKRIDIARRQTARNKSVKSEIKTYVKKFEQAIENNEADKANELFKTVDKKVKQAAAKNIIHKNQASRTSSRLAKKLNLLNA
ncbi:30S ribosomal protein S20 [Anaerococcus sp. AGMB00486]|uniref:Small ribosomal subunit protein bS20 n=2 Tax=Anaerococcus TaxID=165779 RepID=A0ABX2NB93_9FIRM|nr:MULTISPECIES: 30S ribosomal protein S20 [Anaerococcus]MDY3006965.1 30S ribosomal protein S20 [Anaerococcus porci]MSS78214.1 30S ribosomal protein S20 [Anaerococcus porci]NVF11972.1 30S ribosomal protein S20 [Anaerococcus faecalis]